MVTEVDSVKQAALDGHLKIDDTLPFVVAGRLTCKRLSELDLAK